MNEQRCIGLRFSRLEALVFELAAVAMGIESGDWKAVVDVLMADAVSGGEPGWTTGWQDFDALLLTTVGRALDRAALADATPRPRRRRRRSRRRRR